jgi:BMFP domain-containing protein YqiC
MNEIENLQGSKKILKLQKRLREDSLQKAAEEIEEMWRRCGENIDQAIHHIAQAKIAHMDLRPKI